MTNLLSVIIIIRMNILAIDIGTSAIKVAILDQTSAQPISHVVKVPYDLQHPTADAAEIDPEHLQQAIWKAVQTTIQQSQSQAIDGIGLSSLMPALVLLDEHDQPLAPIWIHLDRRSRPLARQVWQDVGWEFLQTCGNRPLPGGMSVLCYGQLLREKPEIKGRVCSYLHVNGWIGFLLTRQKCFDVANASFTGLFNTLTDQQWSMRWCNYFQIDPSWLPDVVCGTTTLGTLCESVAKEWGIPAGIPVKIGTADTSSGMLLAGMTSEDLFVTVGTTTVLARFVDQPRPDAQRLTRMYGVGKQHIYAAHNPVGGSALPWLLELCFTDYIEKNQIDAFYKELIPEVAKQSTEVRLDPPFLGGDRLNLEARRASYQELTLATTRLDLLAALLHAMRDGYRTAFQALEWGNRPIERVFLTGGGHEILRTILPELSTANIHIIEDGALRGVARLF